MGLGTDSMVDRGSDGRTTSRIGQAGQWRNVQGLPETEVSRERYIKWLSNFSNEEDKRKRYFPKDCI